MRYPLIRWTIAVVAHTVVIVALSQKAFATDDGDLTARVERATALASLSSAKERPWHLKLDVTVFDAKGKNPLLGSVEYWQSGESSRALYNFGASTYTTLEVNGDSFSSSSGPAIPENAWDVLSQVLQPGADPDEFKGSVPELRKQKLGKTPLECIMFTQHEPSTSLPPLGLFPTYCLDPGTDELRLKYNFGGETILRNRLGKFLGKEVTTVLTLQQNEILLATAKISVLSTYQPQSQEFTPSPDMKKFTRVQVAGGVIAGKIITKEQPIYPISAREKRLGGTVVLRAIIGRDGRIHSLRPLSSPDPDLAISALDAVRHWTYHPYLLGGEPTEVDTTIMVNFNIN